MKRVFEQSDLCFELVSAAAPAQSNDSRLDFQILTQIPRLYSSASNRQKVLVITHACTKKAMG